MKPKNKILQHLGFIAFAGFSASAVHAANDLWIGNTDANFATLSNWTGSVTPNGNTPQFGVAGTVGSTLNNDIASASYAGLTFNSGASAYTISGNSFALGGNIVNNGANTQTINTAMTISATRTVNATSGQLVLGGNITGAAGLTLNPTNKITLAGTNNFATGGSFSNLTVNGGAGGVDITGSTTLGNGGATNANGYLSVGGNVTVTIPSGGSLTVNGSTAATPTSAIGQNIAGTSTLLVNGGAFTIGANTGLLLANGSSGNAVLTISSGTATINRGTLATTGAGTETRLIQMGRDGTGTATINLNGGTLATGSQFVRDGSTGAGSGTANFVFGGGTLKALGAQTDWLQSTTASSAGQNQGATGGTVNTGALALSSVTTTAVSTIDANGFSVAINSAISGTGGFNINSSTGTGTVALGGANTYTGPTTISAGRLNVISPGSIDTSAVALGAATLGGNGSVADVTANNVGSIITNGNGNTDTLTLASLAFSASGTANLNLTDLNTPIAVTNTLAIGSGFTVNVTTAPSWVTGQTYNLISYATLTGLTSNILKGTISGLGARQIATLGNTGSTNGNITLAITGNTPVWTGIQSNAWTTAPITPLKNWKLLNGGAGTDFVSNDQVIFNDSATGTTSVNISTANVQVASAVFSNDSKPYTISSTGGFGIADGTSPASLTKSGTATLTLNTINSYTGSTHIDFNATLQLGDGTTNGDIASSSVITNDGTLVYNRAGGSFSYANVISGFGGVVKNGTGTQILSGSNTYSGGTTINGGILQVGSGGTTGTPGPGTITINNNASLVFNRTNDVVQGTDFSLIDGTGTVTQAGTGAVTLSFGNTYSGGTAITSGTLLLGNDTGAGSGTIALADGTTLGASANNLTVANPINVTGTASLGQNANNVLTLTGALTGSGTLQNKTASGSTPNLFLKGDLSGFIGTLAITNGNTNTTAFWRFGATGGATIDLSHATVNLISGPSANVSPGFIDATTVANTMKIGTLTGGGTFQGSFNGTANVFNILEVGNLNTNSTFSGVLGRSSNNMMQLSLTKVGTGTLTLSGTNIYTGDTTVNAGVLAVSGNAIANANKLVINGGKVDPMGATEVVGTLYFGATQQATGTWGATGSTATHIDDVHFTGTGVVSVTTGPPAGYSAWADLYASGQTMDQDHDNDGVKNGVEYFMGQTGSTFTANPAPVNGAVTWPMGATYTGVYGTDYEVQTSTDLVNWTQVPIGTGDNTVAVTAGTSVVYDMPAGGKSFVRLVVKN